MENAGHGQSGAHLMAASAINGSTAARSPFMPVRKGGPTTPKPATTSKADAFSTAQSSVGLGRPGVMAQPLTSSALANWTASAAKMEHLQPANGAKSILKQNNYDTLNPPASPLCGSSDAGSAISSSRPVSARLNAVNNNKPPSTMLGAGKRYTRQIAPASPEDIMSPSSSFVPPTPRLNNMISASDLRARARVTSGSAPKRKVAVPGAENADRPSSSLSSSHARLPQTPSSSARPRSKSITRPAVPAVPASIARPASRAGGDHASGGISRPASRMDDYGPESIIRADPNGSAASIDDDGDSPSGSQLNGALANLRLGHSRVVSVAGSVLNAPRQENVLVCVRVRPPAVGPAMLSSGYVNPAHLEEAWIADSETGLITLADETKQVSDYHFDAVVTGSGNKNVYEDAAKELIGSAMNGFDAVIFAYGQTASGKTFTLSGTSENPGIIPQAVSDIFAYIRSHPRKEFLLRASYIEIYNEQLKDLLAPETAGQVKVRQDDKRRFFVSPLREEVVTNEQHVSQLLARGELNRHTGQTDYNARSSRSHTVFQMVIESRDVESRSHARTSGMFNRPQTPGLHRLGNNNDDRAVVTSRLSLIDLAGSEKATSQADRRMEGAFINKSLLTLEKVIAALTEHKAPAHIPYRDSKLTQILQPSLSGEARVAVICTINPSPLAVQESTSTLKFAQRVKKVTLHAERNEVVGDKALICRYEQTIAEMTAYISQLEQATGTPSAPATPRQNSGSYAERTGAPVNTEVAKAKEDMAKIRAYIVNAKNIDDARDEAPRPVSPVKPVKPAELPYVSELQEQLLDAQDRIGELEETNERQQDEIAALKADLASRPNSADPTTGSENSAIDALKKRNEELERQCREFRVILANEDTATALKSERRLAAREWSDKLLHLQNSLDRSRAVQQDALAQLAEERKKTASLEKALLKKGSIRDVLLQATAPGSAQRGRRRSGSLDGLSLLSHESPMLSTTGSYFNLDAVADSPLVTPLKSRLR